MRSLRRLFLRRKPTPQPIINDRIAEQIGETRTSHE